MQRPNILICYVDQMRLDALGVNGNPHVHTPNLDQLAAEGATFTHHFVQHPLCMPSRVSMLSGQYPATLNITHMGVPVPEDLPVLPTFLRQAGYRTANIGKLHFLPHANRDHRNPHPAYNFDHLQISDEPGVYEDAYRAWARAKKPHQINALSVGLPPARKVWHDLMGRAENDGVLHADNEARDDFIHAHVFPADDDMTHTAFVAEQTAAFLRQNATRQPFLCIAGFYSPHAPLVAPQKYFDLYQDKDLPLPQYPYDIDIQRPAEGMLSDGHLRNVKQGYYAMISEVDDHIGRILDTLNELGLAENTVVVFTSDHGEWLGDHLRFGKGYPADDRVSRVPLIIRWPGRLPVNQRIDALVESVDIVPTLLDAVMLQKPTYLQGESLLPLLRGEVNAIRTSALTEAAGWKTLRVDSWRYLIHDDGREGLWNLDDDPGEYHDLAQQAVYTDQLVRMRHLLLQRLIQRERPHKRTFPY